MSKKLLFLLGTVSLAFSINAQTTFNPKQIIDTDTGDNPYAITSGLIDNDAFIDIIIGTDVDNMLRWYKNNGDGTFTLQPAITNTISSVGGLILVDLNNDTFLDVLVTAYSSDSVTWYANDGLGNFGAEQLIATVNGASGLAVGNIDADTTIDVAVTSYDDNTIIWFSNDGAGNFSTENMIDNTLSSPGSINLRDIDNDGDLDAVVATAVGSGNVDVIEIFRNNLITSGTVSFTKDATSVSTGKNYFFNAIFEDLDGDLDYDILATELFTASGAGNFYKYINNGTGFTEMQITTSIVNPAFSQFKDLDNDGLNDIILSSGTSGVGNDIVWFKNNGAGAFGDELVIDDTQSQAYLFTVNDFENDGDLDIASIAYNQDQLNWFENLKFTLGLNHASVNEISMYPNPVSTSLSFVGLNEINKVDIYDILGKHVLTKEIQINQSLDVSSLQKGLYFIKFNGSITSYKFVKK